MMHKSYLLWKFESITEQVFHTLLINKNNIIKKIHDENNSSSITATTSLDMYFKFQIILYLPVIT